MTNEWLPAFLFVASFAVALEPKSVDFEGIPTREPEIRERVSGPLTINAAGHLCTFGGTRGALSSCTMTTTYPASSATVTSVVRSR